MKRFLFYTLLAGMLLFAVSCIETANEEENTCVPQESGKVVFRASLVEPQTKTTLSGDENNLSVYWLKRDKLSVFWKGVLSNDFETLNDTPSISTEIEGTLPTGGTVEDENYYIVSYRPASSSGGNYYDYNNGSPYLRSWITTGQSAAQENNVSSGVLMHAGRSEDFSIQMYNLCGLFRFKITNSDDIRKIAFKGRNNEYISGPIEFEFDENGVPVKIAPDSHVTIADGAKTITLTKEGKTPFEKDTWYYIALTPTVFTKGIRVLLYTSTSYGARNITTPITIARNHCLSSSKLDGALTTDYTPAVDVAMTSTSGTTLWPHGTMSLAYTLTGPISNALTLEDLGLTNSDVQWSSSDETVATVSGGVVTGVADGNATITVEGIKDDVQWFSGSISVTVTEAASQLVAKPFTVDEDGTQVYFASGNLYTPNGGTNYSFNTYQGQIVSSEDSWNPNGERDLMQWTEVVDGDKLIQVISVGSDNFQEYESKNLIDGWILPSLLQWKYILLSRSTSIRYAKATINGIQGLLIFPDDYVHPTGVKALAKKNTGNADYSVNNYSGADWTLMEIAGVVFLPASGNTYFDKNGEWPWAKDAGHYWSSMKKNSGNPARPYFTEKKLDATGGTLPAERYLSVRLVQIVPPVNPD